MNTEDHESVALLREIRNWIRAASHKSVHALLTEALPDAKSRLAYQMFDGTKTADQVRVACKMSPNVVVSLAARCCAMGLMELRADKKRVRLFDLNDFALLPEENSKTKADA
jgi:hypothetical protein